MDTERNNRVHTSVIEQSDKIEDKPAFIALLILCSGLLISWIAYSQWQSTIASYTQDIGIPLDQYSLLWALNGFLIVVGQPFIKWITKVITSEKCKSMWGRRYF